MKLYISFHGGTGTSDVNNILGYDLDDTDASPTSLLPTTPTLTQLRAFVLIGEKLYVANSYKKLSQVLEYQVTSSELQGSILAGPDTVNSLYHPFGITFDSQGNLFVSNQDSNVVTRLNPQGQAGTLPSALEQYPNPSDFLSGTFVASAQGDLPGVSKRNGGVIPTDVPVPQGLEASFDSDGKVQNSVRDVLLYEGILYVVDEVAGAIKAYDLVNGGLLGYLARGKMDSPTHLLLHDQTLYIAAGKSIFQYDLSQGPPVGKAKPKKFLYKQLDKASGMAFDAKGNFYVAERKKQKVLKYKFSSGKLKTALKNLPDQPEFISFLNI